MEISHILQQRRSSMQDVYDCLMETVGTADKEHTTSNKEDEEAPMAKDPLNISNSLTKEGAKLATQLAEIEHLWEKLAVLWTGFLLYLAASTRASKHRARLAGKRELATHLWALLSHADFLASDAHGHTFIEQEEHPYDNTYS